MTDRKTEMIEFCQKLIRIPSPSGAEKTVAKCIAETMQRLGYSEVWIDDCGSVIGKVKGQGGGKSVLLDGHIDAVGIVNFNVWRHNPFGGDIDQGRIYGRGASDMKGSVAAMVYAGAALVDQKLPGDVYVSGTVQEECFEGIALGKILEKVKIDTVIIGEASECKLKIGQKGRAEVKLRTTGKSCHSSNPQLGINALYKMTPLLGEVRRIKLPKDPKLGEAFMVATDIVSKPFPGASVIPEECEVTLDRRLLVGETEEVVLKPIQKIIERLTQKDSQLVAEVFLSKGEARCYTGQPIEGIRFFPAWLYGESEPFVQAARKAMLSVGIPDEMSAYYFCTNGSMSAGKMGIPTLGFGPSKESLAHVVDEYIEIAELTKAAEGFQAIASALAH
jgi:putative selenium metabolism hydrolase